MIRRLRVRGYKSLKDASLALDPVTVVMGPNGTGKSNLLDLVGLLSELARRDSVREAFTGHRGRPLEAFHSPWGFGPKGWEKILQQEQLRFSVEVDLELHPGIVQEVNDDLEERERVVSTKATYTRVTETRLRYEVEIGLHPGSGEIFVTNEALRALKQDLEPKAESVRAPFLEKRIVEGRERFIARVERQSHPRYFDTGRTRTLLSELSDPVYHPHVVAAAREIASFRVYYVEPGRMREEVGVQSAEEPGRNGELLAPYYYMLQKKHPATLRSIVRALEEIVPGIRDLRVDPRDGQLEIMSISDSGAEYPVRLLSEGTLRLLAILGIASAPCPPALVVYEEPENGVNPARLDLIARIVRNAAEVRHHHFQFLLTTHSSLLCDLLPEHLWTCRLDSGFATRFERFPFDPQSLFFQREIERELDGASPTPVGR